MDNLTPDVFTNPEYENLLFENAPIGIAFLSLDGKIIHANKYLRERLGYSSGELMGLTFDKLTLPRDQESEIVEFNRLKKGQIKYYIMEKAWLSKLNRVFSGHVHVYGVFKNNYKPEHIIGYAYMIDNVRYQDMINSSNIEDKPKGWKKKLVTNTGIIATTMLTLLLYLLDLLDVVNIFDK